MATASPERTAAVREALHVLGVRRLMLGIHDSAFPPGAADCGYGSPHASGDGLFSFAASLGFDAVQLGPAGQVADANASPYDSCAFSRNVLHLDLAALVDPSLGPLLTESELADAVAGESAAGERADAARARRIVRRALGFATVRFATMRRDQPAHPSVLAFERFRAEAGEWLETEALFEGLCERLGHDDPDRFDPAIRALFANSAEAADNRVRVASSLGAPFDRALLAQWLLDAQRQEVRRAAHRRGVALYGDLQIGWSVRDRFLRPWIFAQGWSLGAPPSRTNPDGQPWGYPVLDPDQLDDPCSPARRTFALLVERMFRSCDGIRVDHPHGLVCPWIYSTDDPDPLRAVQGGTRAFESPDKDDPALRRWAIARREDLDATVPRHADGWVRTLDDAQAARYGRLVRVLYEASQAHGRDARALGLEVLSTCPFPLRAVLRRHGLGRFIVTQKADPGNPHDVYRSELARPEDWVMLGTHDTPPIFALAADWHAGPAAEARAACLAPLLEPVVERRADRVRAWTSSPGALVQAELASLFACEAEHVCVYFTDLFGETEPFNRAGIVHPRNWTLRLRADYARVYEERRERGEALDIPHALALALHARGARTDLQARLRSF